MPEYLSIGDAGLTALLGYAVVFFGIILLMIVVMIMGKLFVAAENRKKTAPVQSAPVAAAPVQPAPGAAGALKLHDVEPRTAAIIMAITADKIGKPINELRFVSIKEVK